MAGWRQRGAAQFEASRPGASAQYAVLRGNWYSLLSAGQQTIVFRASAQTSPDVLVSAEQFGIGGSNSVRGYLEREIVGDQGGTASIEWSMNLNQALASRGAPLSVPGGHSVNVSVFADAGGVRNHAATACMAGKSSCTLGSAGVGLQWSSDKRWTLRADLARALRPGSSTGRGEHRLHISFNHVI